MTIQDKKSKEFCFESRNDVSRRPKTIAESATESQGKLELFVTKRAGKSDSKKAGNGATRRAGNVILKEAAIDITRSLGNCVLTEAGVDITRKVGRGASIRARDDIRRGAMNATSGMTRTRNPEQAL